MTLKFTVALIQNAGLLLAISLVFDLATNGTPRLWSPRRKVFAGIAAGTIGVAMIVVAHTFEPGVIFDTRSVLLSVTGLFLGAVPAAIAMVMTALARLWVGGIATWIGIGVIVASGLTGILWRFVYRGSLERIPLRSLYGMGLTVHAIMIALIYLLPGDAGPRAAAAIWLPVMLVHPLATVALGALMQRRLRHQRTSEDLRTSEVRFRALAENASDLIYRYELAPVPGFTYVSPSATTITGYTSEELCTDPNIAMALVHPDDRALVAAIIRGDELPGQPLNIRWIRKDGKQIWTEHLNTPVLDTDGHLVAIEGIARDVSASRNAHEALREQKERLRLALSASGQSLFDLDVTAGIKTLFENDERRQGFDEQVERGQTREEWLESLHAEDREQVAQALDDYLSGRSPEYRVESRRLRDDGSYVWTLSMGSIVARDAEDRPLRMLGTLQDITPLKEAEMTARRAQAFAQSTLDALSEHICVLDGEGRVIAVNAAWREFAKTNGDGTDVTFEGWNYLLVCRDADGTDRQIARDFATGLTDVLEGRRETFTMEYPCHSPDEKRWFRAQVTRYPEPGPARVVIAHENITKRMIAERELRKVLRAVEQSPVSIVITDPDGNIEYVNPKFVETTGYALDELVGRNPRILQSGLTPPERFKDLWDTITRGDVWEGVFVNRKKNGEIYWDQATIAPIRGIRGDIVGYVGAKVDITARMAEEEERARLTRIIETSQASGRVGSWEIDLDRGSVFMSAEAYRILELSPDSFTPTVEGLLELFEPESARDASLRIQQAIETGTTPDLDVKVITAAGHHKWLHLSSSVTSDGERATRITGAVQDITERKLAEHERIELTRRLSHVQKLESLGILAGGVAHDINNVLSAINNVASTHRPRVPDTDPLAHSLDTILKACQRGRSVVSSLLYFAREKVGARGIVDLNAIVREITGLLGQTTLERVRLTTDLQDPLDPIEGDAPAISQAIMNLCLNSVDAMPRGGELTIRTRRLESGQIELTVVDDGLGMSPEVLELAAEPFFTTKPTGKGTGLGLAMVYGTVTAHGGTLDIRSKLNHGTEVTLTFPSAPVDASVVLGDKSSGTSLQNDLHVLLVDDDELILETFVPLLEALGHRVKAVNSGRAALDAFKGGLEPELVILDMNMPGMTGDEALRRMLDIRPLQHVLICTGFSDVDLTELSSLGPYISSIRKPFTVEELEKAIHELNARP